jgi:hypothetical protein
MRLTQIVSATRRSRDQFWRSTLLGQSLLRFPPELLPAIAITFENEGANARGLPELYNRAIEACPSGRYLLFVHDDVYLHDVFLQHRIADGLSRFDVLGLAGSRGSDLDQPSWGLHFNRALQSTGWQKPPYVSLSGAVAHLPAGGAESFPLAAPPPLAISQYGNLPAPCDLLDGLFLAANPDRLRMSRVRFDENFRFHLYDLDFCRSARRAGLSLATWPILVTHGSAGDFSSPQWKSAARTYLEKWAPTDKAPATDPTLSAPLASLAPAHPFIP